MARKPPKGKSLAEVNPELAEQWHPTKNGELTPCDVSAGSHVKVWWKCDKGGDHEWQSVIYSRLNPQNCPICVGQKAVKSNCLATLNPILAKDWHPTRNGKLTPSDFTTGSGKKVWWKCDRGDDHEWIAGINKRSNGRGCPICTGKKVVFSNCLKTTNPNLAKDWHPTKNGILTPYDVGDGSNKKVWWKCDKGDDHEWESSINSRSQGNGCPVCSNQKVVSSNCLKVTNPKLAKQWHLVDNYNFTISTLNSSYLTLELFESDTNTSFSNPINDTVY
ncbi:zinc-ribbon domain-containing protein, partial [Flavobacteriales bacterium]|nr:zinc-ribbon domain-containing protein [Flavobacteriales bacterium]